MAVLAFIAGTLFGIIAVLCHPWLANLYFSLNEHSRWAEDLLSFRPLSKDEDMLERQWRAPSLASVATPRALSAEVHVHASKDAGTGAGKSPADAEEESPQRTAEHHEKEPEATRHRYAGHDHGHTANHDEHADDADAGHRGGGHQKHETLAEHFQPEHYYKHHAPSDSTQCNGGFAEVQLERGISLMTLGAVTFQMGLFYLVNHSDEDMRRYAYYIIGETISIFCAVLMFNAIYKCVDELTRTWSQPYHVAIFVALVLITFGAMEGIVMACSRVHGAKATRHSRIHGRQLETLHYVMNAKTFGAGAAQMCGAATIRSFGRLQLWAYVQAKSITLFFCTVPLALVSFMIMMVLGHWIRHFIVYWDQIVDESEFSWVEIAEDVEHEVVGLCIGFLLATIARVMVTGSFPHVILSDIEHPHHLTDAKVSDIVILMWIGALAAFICFILQIICYGLGERGVNHQKLRSDNVVRVVGLLVKCSGMTFAWCLCFAFHLLGMEAEWLNGSKLRLMLSLMQSVASLMIIRVLDVFSDMDCTGRAFNKALITMIEFLAVTLGLSWEHAFHECVHVAVQYMIEDPHFPSEDPRVVSLVICGALCAIVLPAYRLYIVPTRYMLLEEFENKERAEEMNFRMSQQRLLSVAPQSPVASGRKQLEDGLEESTYEFREESTCGFREETTNEYSLYAR